VAKASWKVEPLGDRAALATCNTESIAQQLAQAVRAASWPGVLDVVVAYHSVAIHVDRPITDYLPLLQSLKLKKVALSPSLHVIPCCYELGEDLPLIATELNLSPEEVIDHHTSTTFTIFAIGFSPGFPYLGWLPKPLQGIKRRTEPRVKVPAGSVALVGKQSAIYPQSTPGGWALIGQTPLKLVDVAGGYFPLAVGDQVRFEAISRQAFHDAPSYSNGLARHQG
jgi:KipI family sensor histidine kinase inhibitor